MSSDLTQTARSGAPVFHLILKWSPKVDPQTIEKHLDVVREKGAVWWGRLGTPGKSSLSQKNFDRLQGQVRDGVVTYIFLHSGIGGTWRTRLTDIARDSDVDQVDPDLVPSYYNPADHHSLWLRLADFERIDPSEILTNYVLGQSSAQSTAGDPITEGTLSNQQHALIRTRVGAPPPQPKAAADTGATGPPSSEATRTFSAAEIRAATERRGVILDGRLYHQVSAALLSGKHVILTGPPGTAKTTLSQAIAEVALAAGLCQGYTLTTATADWTTYETIGGLRPTPSGELEFSEGQFLAAIRAHRWLVIDELNRSNFDRAFGQLFTVLSGQPVVLPYSRSGQLRSRPLTLVPEGADAPSGELDVLQVPASWRIVATMNVFDKTLLFEMSFALMRRFAFIEVPSPSPQVFEELIDREAGSVLAASLAKKLLGLRLFKDLGPAVFMDVARFLSIRLEEDEADEQGVLFEAFYGYLLPQFEGIEAKDGNDLYLALVAVMGQKERIRQTLNAVLGLGISAPTKADVIVDDSEVFDLEIAAE